MNKKELKAELLACKTYEDFNRRREMFRPLGIDDPEVVNHIIALMDAKGEEPFDQYPPGVHVDTEIV